jgi:DNA-binding transcriptional LysR family regulator
MEHLRGTIAFVTAARLGSFTAAARTLDLSPQAVAASISRLEASLGARLFNRTTRSIALTDEGSAFLAQAEPGLRTLSEATQSIRDRPQSPSGLVRISSGAAFARRYVMPQLAGLAKRLPEVRIDLSMDDRKVDLIRDGYDIAIRGGSVVDSTLVARRVCNLTAVLVASPTYLNKYGTPRQVDDLDQHRLIQLRFASGQLATWDFKRKGQLLTYEPKSPVFTLSDPESVGDAAVLGLGIARVSTHFAWPHLAAGRLKLLLNSMNEPGQRELAIHYAHREHLAPRIRAVVEHLLDAFHNDVSLQARHQDLKKFEAQ